LNELKQAAKDAKQAAKDAKASKNPKILPNQTRTGAKKATFPSVLPQ
jgi:hypothetical protein